MTIVSRGCCLPRMLAAFRWHLLRDGGLADQDLDDHAPWIGFARPTAVPVTPAMAMSSARRASRAAASLADSL